MKTKAGTKTVTLLMVFILILLCFIGFLIAKLYSIRNTEASDPGASPVIAAIDTQDIRYADIVQLLLRKHGGQLLKQYIDQQVIALEAKALGLQASKKDIEQELQKMQQGYDSEEEFYKVMKEQLNMSPADIRQDVYFKLLYDQIATNGIEISEDQLDDYVAEHSAEYGLLPQVYLYQALFDSEEAAVEGLQDVQAGVSFEDMARAKSLDDTTAELGGEIGWVDESDPLLTSEVLEVALTLEAGSVEGPLPIDGGYLLIYASERKDPSYEDYQRIREQARYDLSMEFAPEESVLMKKLWKKWKVSIIQPVGDVLERIQ